MGISILPSTGGGSIALGDGAVVPLGRLRGELSFDSGEPGLRGAVLLLRDDLVALHPVEAFVEHGAGGAAAVIADAEQVQHVGHARGELTSVSQVDGEAHRIQVGIRVVVREVGEDFAAVRRFPPEEF